MLKLKVTAVCRIETSISLYFYYQLQFHKVLFNVLGSLIIAVAFNKASFKYLYCLYLDNASKKNIVLVISLCKE